MMRAQGLADANHRYGDPDGDPAFPSMSVMAIFANNRIASE